MKKLVLKKKIIKRIIIDNIFYLRKYSKFIQNKIVIFFFINKFLKKNYLKNFKFFTNLYYDIFLKFCFFKKKNFTFLYNHHYDMNIIHPFSMFEKQFLFKKIDFDEFFYEKNIFFESSKIFGGLNYFHIEKNNELQTQSKSNDIFFLKYSSLFEINNLLNEKNLFFYNFFIFNNSIINLYQIIIYLFIYKFTQ